MPSLGETLAAERRRQAKTLIDAETATCIRSRMLEALEHDDFASLPSPAYVKGYIQSYAKFLDVPAEPLLEQYRAEVRLHDERAAASATPLMPRGASYSTASRQNLDGLPAETIVPRRDHLHSIPQRTWIVVAIVIVVAVAVIWGISRLFAQPSTPSTVPAAVNATTTPPAGGATASAVATTPPAAAVASSPLEPTTPPVPARRPPFKLTFRVTPGQSSSLKVTVDGKVVFDGTISDTNMPPALEVSEQAAIVVGNTSWVTTLKDGVRQPTKNGLTDFTFTLKNTNPAR